MSASVTVGVPLKHNEVWKPIPGLDYSVSDQGRVRRDAPGKGARVGLVLRHRLNRTGYPQIQLRRGGRYQGFDVHTLVARVFIGPKPRRREVNHRDGIKTNNTATNLEYTTHKGNMRHALAHGLLQAPPRLLGIQNGRAKLTYEIADAVRASDESRMTLAHRYGVSASTIGDIRSGRTWQRGAA